MRLLKKVAVLTKGRQGWAEGHGGTKDKGREEEKM